MDEVCREAGCESLAIAQGYCRLHYIKNWGRIKRKELILADGRLRSYIEDLLSGFSERRIREIRQDLASEEAFAHAMHDIEEFGQPDPSDVPDEGLPEEDLAPADVPEDSPDDGGGGFGKAA